MVWCTPADGWTETHHKQYAGSAVAKPNNLQDFREQLDARPLQNNAVLEKINRSRFQKNQGQPLGWDIFLKHK